MGFVMGAEVLLKSPDEAPFDGAEDDLHQLFSGDFDPVIESGSGILYHPHSPPTAMDVENPHVEFINTWIALGISMFMMIIGTMCFIVALEGSTRRVWMRSSQRRWFSSNFPRWFPPIEEPAVQAVVNVEAIPQARRDAWPNIGPVDPDPSVEDPDALPANPEIDDVPPNSPDPNDLPEAVPQGAPNPDPRGLPKVVDPPAEPKAAHPDETPERGDRPNAEDL